MTLAATFLGGAKSRLLPASVPFRFVAAAAIFHGLMWVVLLVDAGDIVGFRGGPGPGLAATHLLTLGVLTTTAIGAATQLLPVATRRALAAVWPVKLVFWLAVPGFVLLIGGMYRGEPPLMMAGAAIASAGLLLFAALLADNLRRAASLPVVSAYGWAALAALVLLAGLGIALALDYRTAVVADHQAAALAHLVLGGFGFMGLLALGFSHILVPMFALAPAPPKVPSFAAFALTVYAVATGTVGALAGSRPVLVLAAATGLAAAGLHLRLMHRVLATGMRKRLGQSFVLVRLAWTMLPITLVSGLAALYGMAGPNGPTLFGFLLFGGWLLTFLLGILQRILPFLASMHVTRSAGGSPPLLSELAASPPLTAHTLCHALGLTVLGTAIVLDSVWLARGAAAVGLAGAVAFGWFVCSVLRQLMHRA